MYDQIYELMVYAGTADIFEDKYCLDKVGSIVADNSPDVCQCFQCFQCAPVFPVFSSCTEDPF